MSTDPAPASATTDDDVSARLAALEAENLRLRAQIDELPAASSPPRGGRWRAVLSAICIVLASLLVAVSVVGSWARVQLVDEDRFVSTFAPLASDPDVQALIIDGAATAIGERVDFQGVTDDLFDGIQDLGLPPRASSALDLLRAPAAQGLENLVTSALTRLIESDAFASAWQTSLQASHRALVLTAAGGGDVVSISGTGELGIQLGPIIATVKERLIDQGVGIASIIPQVDRTIVIAESSALVTVGVVYNLSVVVGWWLPLVALALFVAGILIARRKTIALIGTGVGLALSGGLLAVALAAAGSALAVAAPRLGVSSAALTAIYERLVDDMLHTSVVIAVVGVIVALLAWAQGRSRSARALRTGIASVNAGLRRSLAARGVDTGAFGTWMHAQRVLVRAVLIALLVLWLLLLRPLAVGDVLLVLVVGLVVWWLAELVQRRPEEAATDPATVEAEASADTVSSPTP